MGAEPFSISAYVAPPSPTAPRAAPSTSKPRAASGSRDSGTCRAATSSTATATGTLIRKIHRHEALSTIQPPSSGPIAAAMPPSPAHWPITLPRSATRNEPWIIARLPGVSSAAPTPWSSRAPISWPGDWATPHSAEARANQVTPTRKTRRRPKWSPSEPPTRISEASESR